MIRSFATLFKDLSYIFSKKRAIRKPAALFFAYVRFRIKRFWGSSDQCEAFLGFKIHFPDYQDFYRLWREIFLHETYYVSLVSAPGKALRIIDAGSNVGMSVLFLKYLYLDAKVVALEISDLSCVWIKKNVEDNGLRDVEILNVGVSDHTGVATFYDLGDGNASHGIIKEFLPDKGTVKIRKINVVALSSLLKGEVVDLLKMDIEGSEFGAFREAARALQNVDNIIVELHQPKSSKNSGIDEVLKIFNENGFRYTIYYTTVAETIDRYYDAKPTEGYAILVFARRIK